MLLAFTQHQIQLRVSKQLQHYISQPYQHAGRHYFEKNKRSRRYSRKLKNRIYGDSPLPAATDDQQRDANRAEAVKTILRQGRIRTLQVMANNNDQATYQQRLQCLLNPEYQGAIIFLQLPGLLTAATRDRHAEEFLVDIIEALPETPSYSCIAGKKRPCRGCYGRMKTVVDEYGTRPGRFWSHTMVNQPSEAAKRTARSFIDKRSYISRTKAGGVIPEFDSGSNSGDSDIE